MFSESLEFSSAATDWICELSKAAPGTSDLSFTTQYCQSFLAQFKSCLWKQWLTYWRSPDYNLVSLLSFLDPSSGELDARGTHTHACMVLMSSEAVCDGRDTSSALTIVIGAMSMAEAIVGYINCSTAILIVSIQRTVFYPERAAGMYSALPYAIAQVQKSSPLFSISVSSNKNTLLICRWL